MYIFHHNTISERQVTHIHIYIHLLRYNSKCRQGRSDHIQNISSILFYLIYLFIYKYNKNT